MKKKLLFFMFLGFLLQSADIEPKKKRSCDYHSDCAMMQCIDASGRPSGRP